MTLLDFEELTAYWAEHPPVHVLLAAYLGFDKKRRQQMPSRSLVDASSGAGTTAASDLDSMLSELGPGFASGDVHAGLALVELDFTRLREKAAIADNRRC
jgi:hypothetical protein